MLTSIDSVIREHPDCGLVITGDFNQMSDNFLKTHYRLVQVVAIPTRAMKSIYPGQSYADVLQCMGLPTLNERRELLCKLYFNKIKISSHKLNHLLPEIRNIEYDIRQCNVYPLPRTRTNRYRNSLIPWGLYNCQ